MKPDCAKLKILIVDDEEDLSWILHLFLATQGHKAFIAKNAHEAETLIGQVEFNLALVDAKLPDLDGIELISRIQKMQPEMLCFLVSGFYCEGDATTKLWLESGRISGFISKPFQFDRIMDTIRQYHAD